MISIIIPIYNVSAYIRRCIDSCLKQSYADVEIIAIDDCGTDDSIDIVKSYRDSRIKIVYHKKNKGLSSARNTGLKHARGKYVLFLDSDDYISPKLLELCANEAEESQVDFVSFNSVKVDQNGDLFTNFWMQKYAGESLYNLEINHQSTTTLVGWDVAAWSKLISREFLIKNEIGFDEKQKWFEDHLFSAQLYCLGRFSYLDKTLHYYFQRSKEATQQSITQEKGIEVALYRAKAINGVIEWLHSSGNQDHLRHFLVLYLEQYKIILMESEVNPVFFKKIYNLLRSCFVLIPDIDFEIKPLVIVDLVYILKRYNYLEFKENIGRLSQINVIHLKGCITGFHQPQIPNYINPLISLPGLSNNRLLVKYLFSFVAHFGLPFLFKPKQAALKLRDYYVLEQTAVFDEKYYTKVAGIEFPSRRKAITHYLKIGEKLNLSPNSYFNANSYLKYNSDLNEINMSLFVHYILYSSLEGRKC